MSDEDDEEAEFQREQDARRRAAEQRAMDDYSSSDDNEQPAAVPPKVTSSYSSSDDDDLLQQIEIAKSSSRNRHQQFEDFPSDEDAVPQRNTPTRRTLGSYPTGRLHSSSEDSFDEMDQLAREPGQQEMGQSKIHIQLAT